MTHQQQTGDQGEAIAIAYLQQNGCTILDTNWSSRFGELDIVARQNTTYIFVEVKTRHSHNTESAFASITPSKRDKILKTIYLYLHEHDLDEDTLWRVDAIGIALCHDRKPIIDHVEDVFDW